MLEKLTIQNSSAFADLRVLTSNELQKTDEHGNTTGYEWNAPIPAVCIGPAATGSIVLAERRRIILETSAADDQMLPLTNASLQQTLKVSLQAKKSGEITNVGFIHPVRNGTPSQGINVVINSKQRAIVQLMPK